MILKTMRKKMSDTLIAYPMDAQETQLPDLPNEIWIKLFTYLTHGDLQQVKLVCKHWCDLCRVPELKRKSKLVITAHNLKDLSQVLKSSPEICEYLQYECLELHGVKVQKDLLTAFEYLGYYIRQLKLHESPVFCVLNDYLPELEELILTRIPSVQSYVNNFSVDLYKFPKFKSLHMSCAGVTYYIKIQLLRNLIYDQCEHLERLSLEFDRTQEDLILYTLELHADSLRQLGIGNHWNSKPSTLIKWQRTFEKFSKLEVLKITGNCGYNWLKIILESLGAENRLRAIDLSGSFELSDDLLKLIVRKWANSVESLDLMFCQCITDDGLKQLGAIKNKLHHLNLAKCRLTAEGLLQGLVENTNYALRSLNLSHITSMAEGCICLLAQRLCNLTTLNLENCYEAVTDSSLYYIFRYLKRLRHLVLDDCIHITDGGLIGADPSKPAISNLKGLQTLSLRGCCNLSNRSLREALNFQELRKLELSYCHNISSSGIEGLVQHCPALEDLTISSCFMLADNSVLQIVLGLPRLRKLNVRNCINYDAHSVGYEMTYTYKTLQELTMNCANTLEV
uniref:F-box domain-containing protein n=1 Tax=Glossina austeni TaxID=7395 RepID=A0A1A9UX27_GLOAU